MSEQSHYPSGQRWQPPTPEELHAQLQQYDIWEILGVGGMGAVYKGFQTSLERNVAIKILPPSVGDEDFQYAQRFKQEARTMARLSHPGIVGVHDCGETPGGLLYIVMEYVEGTDVNQMIVTQGHLPAEQALAIALNVCDALSYAHDHGVIHRDIKPANIMVDTLGRVKVADFGLAKTATVQSGLSSAHMTLGTAEYVAPEALIVGIEVDQRADIYSMGVTLYEMLTGKVPRGRFDAASALVPGLDPRFDDVVNRAMRDNREARYSTSAELRQDLMAIHTVPAPKVTIYPPRPAKRTESSQERDDVDHSTKSGSFALWAGIAAALAVGVGVFLGKPWASKPVKHETPPPTFVLEPVEKPSTEKVTPPAPSSVTAGPTKPEAALGSPAVPAPAPVTVETPAVPVAVTPTPALPTSPGVAPAAPTPFVPPAISRVLRPNGPVVPKPIVETDPRLANLKEQFQAAVQRETESGFNVKVANLGKGYLGAVDRAITAASQKGNLEQALAMRSEKQRFESENNVPAEDQEFRLADLTPLAIKDLRKTYRATLAQLDADHQKALQPIYEKYDQALAYYQDDFTKAGKLDEAAQLKSMREEIVGHLSGAPASAPVRGGERISAVAGSFVNSLGMKFIPVPGARVLMCVHETRVKDYSAYAAEVPSVNNAWKTAARDGVPISTGENDPVICVSWLDAKDFCAWLGKKEGRTYRLPKDREWSIAVGVANRESVDETPERLGQKPVKDAFPWSGGWPPPPNAGNLGDASFADAFQRAKGAEHYRDNFPATSPVMSFPPNGLGFFDLAGNAMEWCEDLYGSGQSIRVLRGSSWQNSRKEECLSSRRFSSDPGARYNDYGFRCVLVPQ